MKGLKLTLWFLVLLALLSMAWQNIPPLIETDITLGYEIWNVGAWRTGPIPLYAVIIVSFLAGLCLMWLVDLSTRMGLRKQVRTLEKELAALRAQTGYEEESSSLDSYADEPFGDAGESTESDETLPK
jgi:uncharacterized integral membrane protein